MKVVGIINEIREFCMQNQDPAMVEKYKRYFKEGYDAWGLAPGLATGKAKEMLSMPGISLDIVLEAAPLLIKTGKYEETFFVFLLAQGFSKQWTKQTFLEMEKWFSIGFTNWAHTDWFCGEIMDLLLKKKIIVMNDLGGWRTADNRFQRRAVPVSMIKRMKLDTDFRPYFDFLEPMMMDPAREVHQGLGWFLREAWKKQPEITEKFLLKYKDTAPRLIFQYATEKMDAAGKLRFRKTKS
jgi:3-methyladenine DNA glycosylase AlkD